MRVLATVLLAAVAALGHAADSMTYIEFRFISPAIKAGTFNAAVRKLWRYTDSYARLEEPPDPQAKIHGLMIMNAPNAYLVNRYDNTAKHVVDPGPTYDVIIPVFSSERSPKFRALQMGREPAFFRANGASAAKDERIDGVACEVLVLKIEDSEIKLFLDKKSRQPRQIAIRNPRDAYAVRYDAYRTDLPVDLSLFSVPKGVKVERAN